MERDIGRRLAQWRKLRHVSRAETAACGGVTSETVANIEKGRVPLKWGTYRQLVEAFPVNPRWLATGMGAKEIVITLPMEFEDKVPRNALFSKVYSQYIAPDITGWIGERLEQEIRALGATEDEDFPDPIEFRAQHTLRLSRALMIVLPFLKEDEFLVVAAKLTELIEEIAEAKEKHGGLEEGVAVVEHVLDLNEAAGGGPVFQARARAFVRAQPLAGHGPAENVLTDSSGLAGSVGDVKIKPQWPELKKRLQKATEAVGAKPALAKVLDVDPTQISQWLSESKSAREPGGDYALRMLKWVEFQERSK